MRHQARRDGAPTGRQYPHIGRQLSPQQAPVHYNNTITINQTEFPYTILVAEQHLVLKCELLLSVPLL